MPQSWTMKGKLWLGPSKNKKLLLCESPCEKDKNKNYIMVENICIKVLFAILSIVVNVWTYIGCIQNCIDLNTHSLPHTKRTGKTGEIWVKWVDHFIVSILVVQFYQMFLQEESWKRYKVCPCITSYTCMWI